MQQNFPSCFRAGGHRHPIKVSDGMVNAVKNMLYRYTPARPVGLPWVFPLIVFCFFFCTILMIAYCSYLDLSTQTYRMASVASANQSNPTCHIMLRQLCRNDENICTFIVHLGGTILLSCGLRSSTPSFRQSMSSAPTLSVVYYDGHILYELVPGALCNSTWTCHTSN
jgi:hypothetical protein